MKKALLALLLIPLLFSALYVSPLNSSNPTIITDNTFKAWTVSSSPCVLVANNSVLPSAGVKYFGAVKGGNCTATLKLDNGTYTLKMYVGGYAPGNVVGSGLYTVAPNIPGGCKACENLNNTIVTYIFAAKQENPDKFQVNLVGENSSNISLRFPLAHAPVLVYMHNDTYKRLVKTITDANGIASIDYDRNGCMQYSFMYCCFYQDCGFLECIRAFGIKDSYINGSNPDHINITNITDIPLGAGATSYPLDPPITSFPSIEKIDVCNGVDKNALGPALCFPMTLLLGLLFTAMTYAGKNPFMGFDIGSIKLGRHMKYTPMGVQRGMKVSAQTVQGVGTQVAGSVKAGKAQQKADKASGKTTSLGAATFNAALKSDMAKLAPLGNMVKMVGAIASGNFGQASAHFKGAVTGQSVSDVSAQQRSGVSGMQGAQIGAAGIQAGAGIGHITSSVGSAINASEKAKYSGESRTGAFFLTFLGEVTGFNSIKKAVTGAVSTSKDLMNFSRLKGEYSQYAKSTKGKPMSFNDYLQKRVDGNKPVLAGPDGKPKLGKDGNPVWEKSAPLDAKIATKAAQTDLSRQNMPGLGKSLLLLPVGIVFGSSAYSLAVEPSKGDLSGAKSQLDKSAEIFKGKGLQVEVQLPNGKTKQVTWNAKTVESISKGEISGLTRNGMDTLAINTAMESMGSKPLDKPITLTFEYKKEGSKDNEPLIAHPIEVKTKADFQKALAEMQKEKKGLELKGMSQDSMETLSKQFKNIDTVENANGVFAYNYSALAIGQESAAREALKPVLQALEKSAEDKKTVVKNVTKQETEVVDYVAKLNEAVIKSKGIETPEGQAKSIAESLQVSTDSEVVKALQKPEVQVVISRINEDMKDAEKSAPKEKRDVIDAKYGVVAEYTNYGGGNEVIAPVFASLSQSNPLCAPGTDGTTRICVDAEAFKGALNESNQEKREQKLSQFIQPTSPDEPEKYSGIMRQNNANMNYVAPILTQSVKLSDNEIQSLSNFQSSAQAHNGYLGKIDATFSITPSQQKDETQREEEERKKRDNVVKDAAERITTIQAAPKESTSPEMKTVRPDDKPFGTGVQETPVQVKPRETDQEKLSEMIMRDRTGELVMDEQLYKQHPVETLTPQERQNVASEALGTVAFNQVNYLENIDTKPGSVYPEQQRKMKMFWDDIKEQPLQNPPKDIADAAKYQESLNESAAKSFKSVYGREPDEKDKVYVSNLVNMTMAYHTFKLGSQMPAEKVADFRKSFELKIA